MGDIGHFVSTINDFRQAVIRHRKIGLRFFLAVITVTVLFAIFAPRQYKSEGKLFVRLGRENTMLDATATLGQNPIVAVPLSRENEINSEVEILRSRAIVEQVVDALGPEEIIGGENREKAIHRVAKMLNVEPARKSSVIAITYRGDTPKQCQTVVAKLIDIYLEEHSRLNRPHGSYKFFVEQSKRLRKELSRREVALRDLKNETGLASPEAQRKQIVTRIGRLEDDLLKTEESRAVEEANVRQLRAMQSSMPETQVKETNGFGDDGTSRMRERFYALQLQENEAQSKYTDDHPKMRQIREQIEAARKILDQEEDTRKQVTREPGRLHQAAALSLLTAEPNLASLEARSSRLKNQLAEVRGAIWKLNEGELRVAETQREVDLLEASYKKYSANLEQSRIDQQLEVQQMSNVSVVQPASLEPKPIRPRVLLTLLLGLAVATLGGVALPLAADQYERSIRIDEREISKTAAPGNGDHREQLLAALSSAKPR